MVLVNSNHLGLGSEQEGHGGQMRRSINVIEEIRYGPMTVQVCSVLHTGSPEDRLRSAHQAPILTQTLNRVRRKPNRLASRLLFNAQPRSVATLAGRQKPTTHEREAHFVLPARHVPIAPQITSPWIQNVHALVSGRRTLAL
jgi:hypothetical protein